MNATANGHSATREADAKQANPSTNGATAVCRDNSRPVRTSPVKPLPPDRMSVAKQLEVLRAFVIASNDGTTPAGNSAVAKLVDMHVNNACVGNPFMASAGLLVKHGQGYLPCQDAINFNRAHNYTPDRAAHKLAPVLLASWFGQIVHRLIQLRPRPEADILAELATESGASKDDKSQLVKLLDYLEAAGLINREGGSVSPGETAIEQRNQIPKETIVDQTINSPQKPQVIPQDDVDPVGIPLGAIRFNIDIAVTMQEVSGWDPDRITAFFNGLAQVIAAKGKCS